MSRSIACVLILMSLCGYLAAVQYPFINYKTSDGLPQNYITAITQDQQGYIWIGTQSGVGIFNGKAFIQIISTSQGLPGSYITDIIPGMKDRMWVATNEGLAVLRERHTEKVFFHGQSVDNLIFNPVRHQVMGIVNGRLYRFPLQGESAPIPVADPPGNSDIRQAAMDAEGRLFIVKGNRVLISSSQSGQEWREVLTGSAIDLLRNRGNRILIAVDGEVRSLDSRSPRIRFAIPQGCGRVSDLDMDDDGSFWLGSRAGLFSLTMPDGEWRHFHAGNGMHFSIVNRVFVDREHTIFAGTQFGLSQLGSVIFRMYKREDGLPSEFVCCMLEDEPGRILVGGYEGISEMHGDTIRPMPVNALLKNHQVRTILKVDSRNYLIGTRFNGIFHWDRGESLRLLRSDATVMIGMKDSGGVFWFGTDNGLLRYDGSRFTVIRKGLNHIRVLSIAEWKPGVLIVGTGQGVQIFSQGRFIKSDLENLLGNIYVTDIRVSHKQEILVSTVVNGLFIYQKGTLTHLSTENGLLHNDVWYSLRDNHGNIWINTSVSLDRYRDGFSSHFSKKTGLFGDEGFIHAAMKTTSGSLFFGVSPGIVVIRPRNRERRPEIPPISSMEVRVNDNPRPSGSLMKLGSKENSLEFDFFAVSTRLDHPIYYRWRLLPLESRWSETSLRSFARYTNLRPGRYTFEVFTHNGVGNRASAANARRIPFSIRKPFWMQWWFLLIALTSLFFLLRLFTSLRLRMLEKQKRKLEKRIHEHTSELARKNHELVVLSTTDPLTGLKNRRYLDDKIIEEVHLVERSLFQENRKNIENPDTRILTFFIIDIDHFKMVNDIHGHHAGDHVLVGVAHALKNELRTSDTLIRWGGEEFLVVTRNKRSVNPYQLAERLRTAVASREFPISSDKSVKKTVSVGFARFPFITGKPGIVNWQQVVSLADSALYLAKLNGRDLSVGIEPGPGFTDVPFSEIITSLDEHAAAGRIRLSSTRHELVLRSSP